MLQMGFIKLAGESEDFADSPRWVPIWKSRSRARENRDFFSSRPSPQLRGGGGLVALRVQLPNPSHHDHDDGRFQLEVESASSVTVAFTGLLVPFDTSLSLQSVTSVTGMVPLRGARLQCPSPPHLTCRERR